jgi:hypothetical protein
MKISAASQGRALEGRSSREFTGSELAGHVRAAIRRSSAIAEPWLHWKIPDVFPRDVLRGLAHLPLRPAIADGWSGRREDRNEQRIYFNRANTTRFAAMRDVADAFQSPEVTSAVHEAFAAPIDRTLLRVEYAFDRNGFWLEPHTDIGVKKFTCFVYLDGAEDLGTDIYVDAQTFARRMPFIANSALGFVPGDNTWHAFVKRPIAGGRRSLIINYVSAEWRASEQLSFPDTPVRLPR